MHPTRARTIAAIVVVLAFIAGGLAAHVLLESGAAVPKITPTAKEKAVLTLINKQRTMRHLSALKFDPVMALLARNHNNDMIRRDYFSHDEPGGGKTYAQRVNSVLHEPGRNTLGENIVYGNGPYGTAQGLVTSWMNSPPHRANILNPAFHRTGLGVATAKGSYQGGFGVTVATQDFSN